MVTIVGHAGPRGSTVGVQPVVTMPAAGALTSQPR